MASSFRFKRFELKNEASALKVGTDAVLLGAAMTVRPSDEFMLDIGTGTGVIALMVAQRSDSACIVGIDIDTPSAEEAAYNFENSPWASRLRSVNQSLADYCPCRAFDLIFSNPPYYDNSLRNPDIRESAARHTESLSYRMICEFASKYLTDCGRLSLILPSEEQTRLLRTAASFGLYPFRIIHIRTVGSKPPRRIIAEFCRKKSEIEEQSLTLQEGSSRTDEYSALVGEFYL